MPKDAVNRDFWSNNMNMSIEKIDLPYDNPEVNKALQQVAERHANQKTEYKRNWAHVCSFYVQGKCNRGKACPYRHENITEEELRSMQKGQGKVDDKIRDRFNGENDPLAKKIIEKIEEYKLPEPPADLTISTLFIGGIQSHDQRELIEEKFQEFGKIQAIKLIPSKQCGFVSFFDRKDCQKAFEVLYERLYLTGSTKKLKLLWAKSQLDIKDNQKKRPQNSN
mmetsp:Transcript_11243/g.18920  ORF Transcript_11243/g.18920 Transcript_11243/m.18920 type:complete len:223 (+) Transcript_11243:204-872(+)